MAGNCFAQIFILSAMNLRNIGQRWGAALVTVLGVACVVGVFVAVLSMATGFQRTMANASPPDRVIFMRAGAATEMSSGLSYQQTQWVDELPGIAQENGQPLSSAELFVVVDIAKKHTASSANVSLRGVKKGAFQVRDNLNIIAGRNFVPGKNELIVGRSAQQQFANLALGSRLKLGQIEWQVVGVFSADAGLAESEIWCDAAVLQGAFRRGNSYQSVRAKIQNPESLGQLQAAIARDPRLIVDVKLESDYLAEQAEPLSKFIMNVGYPLTLLMALGAVFGAMNTLYSSVSARTREIATLRAIGFAALPVAGATLIESLLLALSGGVIGSVVAYVVFNGYTVSTLNFASFSQVVFDFAVTPALLQQGVTVALAIGFVGGLFPAYRAATLPVVTALREI